MTVVDVEEEPWSPPSERVALTSVGIDVGSATSHVIFSEIVLVRQGHQLSSRYEVVSREVLHRSPIWLTPYADADVIDASALATLVAGAYAAAGLAPETVDTGAVIVTGEAARKSNAERIVEELAAYAGRFVCATAGPVLEGVLAAHGSGAMSASRGRAPIVNVDIGGGTTKLTLLRDGHVEQVHAVNVGGRLIAWDEERRITRLEDAGQRLAVAAGVDVGLGATISDAEAERIAAVGASVVLQSLHGQPTEFAINAGLPEHTADAVLFSGGVGLLVNQMTPDSYGDLGAALARALQKRFAADGRWQVLPSAETVRATVVGVGQFTMQLSGNTVFVADERTLPQHNLQVVLVPDLKLDSAEQVADAVRAGLARTERSDGDGSLALSLRVTKLDSPAALTTLAEGIIAALRESLAAGFALAVVIDQDVAGILGHRLAELSPCQSLIVVDQIAVEELDFLDVGTVHADSGSVPVVVKSLVF